MQQTLRVLVVDPCPDIVASTAWLLRWWGHEVQGAANADEALERVRSFRPDAVLTEIALPGMDGCSLARRLRQTDGVPDALLVAVTGYATDLYCERCRAAGFDLLLVKPGNPVVLESLLADRTRRSAKAGRPAFCLTRAVLVPPAAPSLQLSASLLC
jgi:CheY-like chemotaxis protein